MGFSLRVCNDSCMPQTAIISFEQQLKYKRINKNKMRIASCIARVSNHMKYICELSLDVQM